MAGELYVLLCGENPALVMVADVRSKSSAIVAGRRSLRGGSSMIA